MRNPAPFVDLAGGLALAIAAAGCGGVSSLPVVREDAGCPTVKDGDGCAMEICAVPVPPSPHVDDCSYVEWNSNPPTGGPHYPRWATYAVYPEPIPRGHYVHAMEHGAVVLLHGC